MSRSWDGDVAVAEGIVDFERQMVADRVVQSDHAAVDQVHDRGGRVGLPQRAGVVDGLRRHRFPARDIGIPEAGLPDQLAPIPHGEIETGGSMGAHDVQHMVARGVDEPVLERAIGVDGFRNGNVRFRIGGLLLRPASRESGKENDERRSAHGEGHRGSDSESHDHVRKRVVHVITCCNTFRTRGLASLKSRFSYASPPGSSG